MCDQTRAQGFLGQRIARRIDDIDEVKPCRRCRRARARAISSAHQLDDPLDRLLATPDGHQGARDIAHHVMQEGIGLDIDHDDMAMATDFNEVHVAARRARLTACGAERREIQLAHQMRRRGLHVGDIERLATPGDIVALHHRPKRLIDDHVAIATGDGAETRMEIIGHRHGPMNPDIGGKVDVTAHAPGLATAAHGGIEMHDLTHGMHTGIGAATAMHGNRRGGDLGQGLLERFLHGGGVAQTLPATIAGAIIFNAQSNAPRAFLVIIQRCKKGHQVRPKRSINASASSRTMSSLAVASGSSSAAA